MSYSNSSRRKGRLLNLLRPYAWSLLGGTIAVILEGVASLAEPWPIKIVLDSVLKARPSPSWLIDLSIQYHGYSKEFIIEIAALGVVVIALIGAACSYTEKLLTLTVGQRLVHDLRQAIYSHIQRLSLEYHDRRRTGDLISRLTSDLYAIETFVSSGLLGVLINSVTLGGMIILMLNLNPQLTIIALSIAPLLLIMTVRFTLSIKSTSREVRRREAEIVSMMQEVLCSIRVVKALVCEEFEQKRLAEESYRSMQIGLRARTLKISLSPLVDLTVSVGACLVLWFGGELALKTTISPGTLLLFIVYLNKLYKPMRELSKTVDAYSRAAVGYERILDVLKLEPEIRELSWARCAPAFRGKVEFNDVSFSYRSDCPTLKSLSFTIEPGQTVALVGPTGAGKTSIVNLIPRFYDPNRGTIKIDDTDVRLFQRSSLRQQIGFVLQETLLFHGPIWYNISYGKPDATLSDITRAARLANAAEFIEPMPQGYDTVIGERGVTLSGGQRQRIAIARAVIRNAPILILDEVSGLDAESEALVFDALDRLMEGRTAIVVAHRLSTIRSADVIFVVKNGEIVERGSHADLLRKNGHYTQLHQIQFCGETEATGRSNDVP